VKGIETLMDPDSTRHVICTTSTSSGKSIIYTIPIASAILERSKSTALLFFPTKALAHDQLTSLEKFFKDSGIPEGILYSFDGDTKRPERMVAQEKARVLITNPDIVHCTLLPAHRAWSRFLSGLEYIVIDEAHAYTGVFGNHVALVLRRLMRLAFAAGANPRFVCCSATIANPVEHMACLTGVAAGDVLPISKDGSPCASRIYGFWRPPGVSGVQEQGVGRPGRGSSRSVGSVKYNKKLDQKAEDIRAQIRRSPYSEAAYLLKELVRHKIRSIVFVKARHVAELVLKRARDHLPKHLRHTIASYRAGYLANERRRLEQGMSDGSLLGMVATNALELGIDIGTLDATVHVGFPGTKASLMQQVGRAGRGDKCALAILIAMDCPIDHYVVANPNRALFSRSLRLAVADASNPSQMRKHVIAAAWEHPLDIKVDIDFFGGKIRKIAAELAEKGQLRAGVGGTYTCETEMPPARFIGIRDISDTNITLKDERTGRVLETMDANAAPFKLYEGAVYMHQGKPYVVQKLDLDKGVCHAKPLRVGYYTEPRHHTRVQVLGGSRESILPGGSGAKVCYGGVGVSHRLYGYYRRSNGDSRVLEKVESTKLPPVEFTTKATWIRLPQGFRMRLSRLRNLPCGLGALHAIEHVLISLCPLVMACDSMDFQGQCTRSDNDPYRGLILLYERCKGGIGVISQVASRMEELLTLALSKLKACGCSNCCPACGHHPRCLTYNEELEKDGAIAILESLLGMSTSI